MRKINLFQICIDIFKRGILNLLIVKEFGLNMLLKDNKQNLKIEGSPLMISNSHGIMEYQELTHCFKKID
jgi:hypothetical protein